MSDLEPRQTTIGQIDCLNPKMVELLRKLTPAERVTLASQMQVAVRRACIDVIRRQPPGWSQDQINRELIRIPF